MQSEFISHLVYPFLQSNYMVAIELSGVTYNYEGSISLQNIQYFILTGFGLKQGEYTVVYVDEEGDHITLGTTDDYEIVSSVATQNLRLIVTSHKPASVVLETAIEIAPLEQIKIQQDKKARLQQEAKKKQADKRIKQEQLEKKKADNERKRIQKLQAERIKQQKLEAKKIAEQKKKIIEEQRKIAQQEKKAALQEKKKQQQQLKEKAKIQKKQKVDEKKIQKEKSAQKKKESSKKQVSPVSTVEVIQQNKQLKKSKSKQKINKKSKVVEVKTVEKIGQWDVEQLNKYIDQRIKKFSSVPIVDKIEGQSFNIGLEYPTTLEDVAKLKSEALQKLNAFYQAEHAKLAEKQKEQKAKAIALEKEKKKKLEKQAKQKEAKQKQVDLKSTSNLTTQ